MAKSFQFFLFIIYMLQENKIQLQYIAYQTGIARDKFMDGTFKPVRKFIDDEDSIERIFLSHEEEAEGEMLDFKQKFGHLFNDQNVIFKDYKVFLSIGSTSTQGWQIDLDGTYKVIIPSKNVTPNIFMKLGATSTNSNDLESCINSLDTIFQNLNIGPTRKVLCFNAIGYSFDKSYTGHNGLANLHDYNLTQKPEYTLLEKLRKNFQANTNYGKNIDIFSRHIIEPNTRLQLGGSWASGLAVKLQTQIIDIGGGAVHIYGLDGTKLTTKPLSIPLSTPLIEIKPNDIYREKQDDGKFVDYFNDKRDDGLLKNIKFALIEFEKNTDFDRIERKMKDGTRSILLGGGQKSKRRKSKRKRSKRRHR